MCLGQCSGYSCTGYTHCIFPGTFAAVSLCLEMYVKVCICVCGQSGWAGGEAAPLWKNKSSHSSLLGVPGPQPPVPCNKEGIMLFLSLYLPRVPMIFFLSESNFLLTFLPDVAKHDLCKRTWLAACFLPGAPQNSWKARCLFLSRKGARLPGVPGPVLPLGWLDPNSSRLLPELCLIRSMLLQTQ